jgi:hypothetical protein
VRAANLVDDSGEQSPIFRPRRLDRPLLFQGRGIPIHMTRLRLRIARLALALAGATVLWACNAPFIPVPPPGQTASFTKALVADGAGGQKTVWTAHGTPSKNAAFSRFYVFDTDQGSGVIALAAADGHYDSPAFEGTDGDRVEISYETPGGAHSRRVCFQLVEGAMAPTCQPP